MANWYLAENDGTAGPFPFELLRQLASIGRLKASDQVREEGQNHWRPADSVVGLFPDAAIAAQPIAAPLKFRAVEVDLRATTASYWLLESGVPKGPYPGAQLGQWLSSGRVTPDVNVCEVGKSAWQPLSVILGCVDGAIEPPKPDRGAAVPRGSETF